MQDINFLKNRLAILNKEEKKDKKFFKISLVVLIVVITITTGLIGFQVYLNLRYRNIQKKQAQLEKEIQSQEEIEESFLFFTNKLALIRKLYEKRIDKQRAIEFISNLFGDDVFIVEMSFEEDGSVLLLTLRSESIFTLEEVFTTLATDEVKQHFKSFKKSELRRSNDGSYNMKLTLGLINTLESNETLGTSQN